MTTPPATVHLTPGELLAVAAIVAVHGHPGNRERLATALEAAARALIPTPTEETE